MGMGMGMGMDAIVMPKKDKMQPPRFHSLGSRLEQDQSVQERAHASKNPFLNKHICVNTR